MGIEFFQAFTTKMKNVVYIYECMDKYLYLLKMIRIWIFRLSEVELLIIYSLRVKRGAFKYFRTPVPYFLLYTMGIYQSWKKLMLIHFN